MNWFKVIGIVLLSLTLGCGSCDDDAAGEGGNNGGDAGVNNGGDASGTGDGGADVGTETDTGDEDAGNDLTATREDYCQGSGQPVAVGDSGDVTENECLNRVASRVFQYGICSCERMNIQDRLIVDAFDSSRGPYDPAADLPGGSVGVNEDYENTNVTDIGGSLVVAGTTLSESSSVHRLGQNLWVNGPYLIDDTMTVDGDVRINGTLTADSRLNVGGDLILGESYVGDVQVAGMITENSPFTVNEPCGCEPEEILDISAFVTAGQQNNHNDDVDLDPTVLNSPAGAVDITLDCGRLYIEEINTTAPVTIRITGRTLLYVGGDVTVNNPLEVILEGPDAELDLMIGGSLQATDSLILGDATRPSAVRTYIGGSGQIVMSSGALFAGFLYAPNAEVLTEDQVEVFGAIFTRRLSVTGRTIVHYDSDILSKDLEECPGDGNNTTEPNSTTGMCTDNGDCFVTEACVDGMCGNCVEDSDCSTPLICTTGGTCGVIN